VRPVVDMVGLGQETGARAYVHLGSLVVVIETAWIPPLLTCCLACLCLTDCYNIEEPVLLTLCRLV